MLIVGASQDAAVVMKQYRELGLTFKVFARGDVVSTTFQEAAGDPSLGNGIQEATYWDPSHTADPALLNRFKAKYNTNPLLYAVMSYYTVMTIAEAVKIEGAGRQNIQKGLAKVDWKSPIGPIKFNANNQANPDMFVVGFVDGKISLVSRVPSS